MTKEASKSLRNGGIFMIKKNIQSILTKFLIHSYNNRGLDDKFKAKNVIF